MNIQGCITHDSRGLGGVWVWDRSDDRFARSQGDGTFHIENVPEGDKELVLWKRGFYSTTVKIPAGGNSDWGLVDRQRDSIRLMRNYDNPQSIGLTVEMAERVVRCDPPTYVTYSCPVSNLTYAGRPNRGTLIECPTDLKRAVGAIYGHSRKHGQPVTWVINDQEYTDRNGLLPFFTMCQEQGDAIVVTAELTTRPKVDVDDFEEVLRWIHARCEEAGLRIDGLWSLKYFESDLEAILRLPPDEFGWARNLAGSCWHQYSIDESTWGGCPFGPYYPALHNIKAPSTPRENGDILMLEWLTRDINAILRGGFPATFSLDPADAMRIWSGGYSDEWEGLSYSNRLMDELARQASGSEVYIQINEEARLYFEEGHDKNILLGGMFEHAHRDMDVVQGTFRDVWRVFRAHHPRTPERAYSFRTLDYRQTDDQTLLFEDEEIQAGFIKSRGIIPVELYDYSRKYPGGDNVPFPREDLSGVEVARYEHCQDADRISVELEISSSKEHNQFAVVFWELGLFGKVEAVSENPKNLSLNPTVDGHGVLRMRLEKGSHAYQAVFQVAGDSK